MVLMVQAWLNPGLEEGELSEDPTEIAFPHSAAQIDLGPAVCDSVAVALSGPSTCDRPECNTTTGDLQFSV